nr:MAG TPA: hypothetical protein [Caudoviricetes sp.]
MLFSSKYTSIASPILKPRDSSHFPSIEIFGVVV